MTTQTIPETTVPLEPTRERTARDVLLAAARYIEEHGWKRNGWWRGGDSPVCVEGGIMAVLHDSRRSSPMWYECRARFMAAIQPSDELFPWTWNDTPGRTEAEVLAALRAAADTAP